MDQIKDDFVGGLFIRVQERDGVPPITPFSRFLADCISEFRCEKAVDFGCGSGVQAILLAKKGARIIYALDCLEECVEATIDNAKLNDLSVIDSPEQGKIDGLVVRQAHNLSALKGLEADLLVSNPPTMPSRAGVPVWADGGVEGRDVLEQLIREGPDCISRTGEIVIVHSSLCGLSLTLRNAEKRGLSSRILCSQKIPFRDWYYDCLNIFHGLKDHYDCIWEERDGKCWERIDVVSFKRMPEV